MSSVVEATQGLATTYWGTNFAGLSYGVASASMEKGAGVTGPMPLGSQLNLNSSNDLRKIIRGYSGAYISSITYTQGSGIRGGLLTITGAGPSGFGSGSITLTILCESGCLHDVSLSDSTPGSSASDKFEDTTPIVGIFWNSGGPTAAAQPHT